jgi:D-alanyl-D-alanine carboxypeptidase
VCFMLSRFFSCMTSNASSVMPDLGPRIGFKCPPITDIVCLCGSTLGQGKLAENGHQWGGHPASTFSLSDSENIQFGPTYKITMMQGEGSVCDATCKKCHKTCGWSFVASPISQQTGKVGFMLPCVQLNDDDSLPLWLAPPVDDWDKLAVNFMSKHGVAGLSATFHVHKTGKTISRGWGYAKVAGDSVPMLSSMPLRIASISKTITAVAIMRLVEAGKLDLDVPALPLVATALNNDNLVSQCKDSRAADITVRHLLHHVGGGWPNQGLFDPMYLHRSIQREELIPRILADVALNEEPGKSYAYSNFGYCLLGRVLEATFADGRNYEQIVRDEVLAPCGITNASIGDPNEENVGYYTTTTQAKEDADSSDVVFALKHQSDVSYAQEQRMDAHGGWVMSTDDIVRFACALDEDGKLLTKESVAIMKTPLPQSGNYGIGLFIHACGNVWHTGALQGTASVFVKTHNYGGLTWALALNTTSAEHAGLDEIDPFAWSCVPEVLKLAGWTE